MISLLLSWNHSGFNVFCGKRIYPDDETANLTLDTLQTLPTLVYLLPAVMLFRIGDVSAVIAVTLYATAPAIRYAMIGMSQVPVARLEAAQISGCTRWQTLRWIRFPAALPTLLVGVNQTIMMALSILVIASLVSAPGLGTLVLRGIRNLELGVGLISGFCIVLLAIMLDRVSKKALSRINASQDH